LSNDLAKELNSVHKRIDNVVDSYLGKGLKEAKDCLFLGGISVFVGSVSSQIRFASVAKPHVVLESHKKTEDAIKSIIKQRSNGNTSTLEQVLQRQDGTNIMIMNVESWTYNILEDTVKKVVATANQVGKKVTIVLCMANRNLGTMSINPNQVYDFRPVEREAANELVISVFLSKENGVFLGPSLLTYLWRTDLLDMASLGRFIYRSKVRIFNTHALIISNN
jgi:hypothetical protein